MFKEYDEERVVSSGSYTDGAKDGQWVFFRPGHVEHVYFSEGREMERRVYSPAELEVILRIQKELLISKAEMLKGDRESGEHRFDEAIEQASQLWPSHHPRLLDACTRFPGDREDMPRRAADRCYGVVR